MAQLQLTERLSAFSLFQGMGHDELTRLVAQTKFDFLKFAIGEHLAEQGRPVRQLLLVTHGLVSRLTHSADDAYSVEELCEAPFMTSPTRLYGLRPTEPNSLIAASAVSAIAISKSELARLMSEFLAVRINVFNHLATAAQRPADALWVAPNPTLRSRIARFLAARCADERGVKRFHILMERLAMEIGVSRRDISRELKALSDDGLLRYGRATITVEDMALLKAETEA